MIEAVRHMQQHMRDFAVAHCPMHRMRQESGSASGSEPQTQSLEGAQVPHVTSISVQVAEPAHLPIEAHTLTLPTEFHSHDSSAPALSSHPAHHMSISLFPVALIVGGVALPPAWAASPSARLRHNSFRAPLSAEQDDVAVLPQAHSPLPLSLPLLSAILAAGESQLLHASRSHSRSPVQSSVELEAPSAGDQHEPVALSAQMPAQEATREASSSASASSIRTPLALASTLATPAVTRGLQPDVPVASRALAAQEVVNNGLSTPSASSRGKQTGDGVPMLDGFGALTPSASTKPKSPKHSRSSSSRSRRARKFWASASASDSDSAEEPAALQRRDFTTQQSQSDDEVVFERGVSRENESDLSNSNAIAASASASRVPRRQLESSSAASASTSDDESAASDTDSLLDELGVRLGARESRPLLALTAGPKKPAQSMQQRLAQVLERFYAELNNVRGMRCN